jgi:hypothetical protein
MHHTHLSRGSDVLTDSPIHGSTRSKPVWQLAYYPKVLEKHKHPAISRVLV